MGTRPDGKPAWWEYVINPYGALADRAGNAIAAPMKKGIDASQAAAASGSALTAQDIAGMKPLERLGVSLDNFMLGTLDYARQQEQNAFNAREAKVDRDWQQMMRQTYYQDAANSAVAAGYNPAFAMSGSASSPSGAQAHASSGVKSPGVDYGRMLSNVFGVVGSLVAAGVKSSAMQAAQDIRGQYTIDAAKLRGNNALVISKNINDAAMERAQLRSKTSKFNAVRYTPEYFERANLSAERMAAHRYFKDVDSNTMKKLYDLMKDPMGRVMVMHTYKEWQKGN